MNYRVEVSQVYPEANLSQRVSSSGGFFRFLLNAAWNRNGLGAHGGDRESPVSRLAWIPILSTSGGFAVGNIVQTSFEGFLQKPRPPLSGFHNSDCRFNIARVAATCCAARVTASYLDKTISMSSACNPPPTRHEGSDPTYPYPPPKVVLS